ncbi:cytochrome P450 [Lactarius quietus]|nr:cytochrome P450 [Lactarius quietus]
MVEDPIRLLFLVARYKRDPLLDAIPTVGFSDPIFSYISALRFNLDGIPMLKDGYEKTGRGLFKIATFRRWMVLASGPELIEDIRKAPDHITDNTFETDTEHRGNIQRVKKRLPELELIWNADWVKVPIVETMQRVAGIEIPDLNLNFTFDVIKFATIIRNEFIKPVVEERFTRMEEFGEDWTTNRFNGMLMWFLNEAKGGERSLEGLGRRLLVVNFVAIHTTSLLLMHYSLFLVTVSRLALHPFTSSNGVTVPAGTLTAIPSAAVQMDGEIYTNPDEFDGFRFAKLPTHVTYISPGRFFAVNEVKALLAHIVVTYDIKFEEGKQAPRSLVINSVRIPGKANVMFRKRQK